ncbi:MAG TPA: Trp family transcriptional regulator [Candidatus Paceibacterota bacterium]|jgi:uncharacterized protein YerC
MPQVSSKKVSREVLKKISTLLIEQLARVKTNVGAQSFLHEFFTPTEQIMLAKRFAAIVMLEQGYSYQRIQHTLGISSSTVARIWRQKQSGAFDELIRQCLPRSERRSKTTRELESALEVILRGGLPPQGSGRWRYVFRHDAKVSRRK